MQRAVRRALSSPPWRFERPLATPLKVVFCGERHFLAALPLTKAALGPAAADYEIVQAPAADLAAELRDAHVAIPFMERLDAQLLDGAPDLRLVVQFGVGLEGVDAGACADRGIALSNCPAASSGNAGATAEMAIFLAIANLRRGVADLRTRFEDRTLGGLPLPRALGGKRCLVVGAGEVGNAIRDRLGGAWGVDVTLAHAHRPPSGGEAVDLGGRDAILRALPGFDVVVFAAPLTSATVDFGDAAFFAALAPGAVLVNVGRGPIVNGDALSGALGADARLSFASDVGVGDDARPAEPWDPADALSAHPRCYFTPHVAGYADTSYARTSAVVAAAIGAIARGTAPDVWLNRDQ